MACIYNIFSKLGGSPQNTGSWSAAGPGGWAPGYAGWVQDPPPTNPTDPTDDTFDPTGLAPGTYTFTYTVTSGSCTDTSTVTFTVVAPPNAPANVTLNQCTTDADINMFAAIGSPSAPNDNGTWTGYFNTPGTPIGNPPWNPGGAGPIDDVFKPSMAPVGTYVFTYTVTTPGADPNCTNCTDSTVLTIIVTAAPNAGTDTSLTVCS